MKELQVEKAKYFNEAKQLQKEKAVLKQKEEKYNFYNKMPLKKTREERMNKLLTNIHSKKLPDAITRVREQYDRTALNGAFQERIIYNERSTSRPITNDSINFDNAIPIIQRALTDSFLRNDNSKFTIYGNICFSFFMTIVEHENNDGQRNFAEQRIRNLENAKETDEIVMFMNTSSERLTSLNLINELSKVSLDKLKEHISKSITTSNSTYNGMNYIKIQTMKSNKTRAGSYIQLPDKIANKKACINIKNEKDDECIIYCMCAHNHPDVNHASSSDTYKKFKHEIIKPEGILYPIDILKDIPKFEKLNKIKINVFEYDKDFENLQIIYNTRTRNNNVIRKRKRTFSVNKRYF